MNQTFANYHVVCVDDYSSDNTYNVLMNYSSEHPGKFTIVRNSKNLGPGETRNQGYYQSLNSQPSDFIWFVDGDDKLESNDVLQRIYEFYSVNKDMELMFIKWHWRNRWRQANWTSPNAPFSMIFRSDKFQPFSHENIHLGEDIYWHFAQYDSIEDCKIKKFDRCCYVYSGIHIHPRNRNATNAMIKCAFSNYVFKKQYVRDFLIEKGWVEKEA